MRILLIMTRYVALGILEPCTFGLAGLDLGADTPPAAPLLLAGAPDPAAAAGLAPPGLPKKEAMPRCFGPGPDIEAKQLGSTRSRLVITARDRPRCDGCKPLGRVKFDAVSKAREAGPDCRATSARLIVLMTRAVEAGNLC